MQMMRVLQQKLEGIEGDTVMEVIVVLLYWSLDLQFFACTSRTFLLRVISSLSSLTCVYSPGSETIFCYV